MSLLILPVKSIANRLSIPPTGLVLCAITSVQLGSAVAKSLFLEANPAGIVLMRVGFACLVLFLLWRPAFTPLVRQNLSLLICFGLALALMNWSFYEAIKRIPVGIAVALEFTGPLGVAVFNSRKRLDFLWVSLAGMGIFLLTPIGGFDLELSGILLALLAAAFWATYILLSARTGQVLPGGDGLAWAMGIGTLVLLPIGIVSNGTTLLQPQLLLKGFGLAILSSAIPYSCELEALRALPVQVFGVLLSLEPVAAAIAAWLLLGETLSPRAIMAILLVSFAAAGASQFRQAEVG